MKINLASSMVHKIKFKGKVFYVKDPKSTTAFPGSIGFEKRVLNIITAEECLRSSDIVLDAYAGYGISTYFFAQHCGECIAVEKDQDNFRLLQKNTLTCSNVDTRQEDNIKTLEKITKEGRSLRMVDLDATDNFHLKLPLTLGLLNEGGYLWLTSCEYNFTARNFHRRVMVKRYGPDVLEHYERGINRQKDRIAFKNRLVQHVESLGEGINVVHFAVGYVATRVLFSVNIDPPKTLIERLEPRGNYFGPQIAE